MEHCGPWRVPDLAPVVPETREGVVAATGGAPEPAPYLTTYAISLGGDGVEDETSIDV